MNTTHDETGATRFIGLDVGRITDEALEDLRVDMNAQHFGFPKARPRSFVDRLARRILAATLGVLIGIDVLLFADLVAR